MIRKFKNCDIEQIIKIWLNGNIETHHFVAKQYWKAHAPMVRKQLLQAEVYVYETDGVIQGFVGMQENYIAGIFFFFFFFFMGIGKQLLNYMKQIYTILSLNVYQQNERAIKFYQQEGFSIISEDVEENTGQVEYTMSWNSRKC